MKYTKLQVARIARKLWRCPSERIDGRGTVRAVLEAAGHTIEQRKKR